MTFLLFIRHHNRGKLTKRHFSEGFKEGIKSMLPAIGILIFAWTISHLINALQTGEYLAGIVESSNLNIAFLPVVVFIMAGFIAFATGTSWGSFAIRSEERRVGKESRFLLCCAQESGRYETTN